MWGRSKIDETRVWYTVAAFFSFIPLLIDAIIHSTLSPSSNLTPSVSINSSQSGCAKHSSDFEHNVSSIPLLPASIISLTTSAHASITGFNLVIACSAANSSANTFNGVVLFPTPFNRLSRIFCGRLANSLVHHPSPNNPTRALRAPRSR